MKKNIAKRRIILGVLFIILAVFATGIFACTQINDSIVYEETSAVDYQRLDLENYDADEYDETYTSTYNSASGTVDNASQVTDILNMSNVVIFIYFSDETEPAIDSSTIAKFTGSDNSLYDYYYDTTYGKIIIDTYYASTVDEEQNTIYYAYQSAHTRAYYLDIGDGDSRRYAYERELLTGAIAGFNNAMDFTDINVDQDNDGYVDNISFVVSGSYINTIDYWGGLLWPHAWRMSVLNTQTTSPTVYINNKIVEYYTFNFLDKLTVGLICHEFSHVLGSPDLYHYDYDTSYYQVGYWDLMHFECATPQYMTTYMRYKYLGARSTALSNIYTSKISQITTSGSFTLKPTTVVTEESTDFLAYKIEINDYESIWIEYRNKNSTTYDSSLPGSGLIIYRVNTKASVGNQNGKHNNSTYPDEVYIYRPDMSTLSALKAREAENLNYAYLSLANAYFQSLGQANTTTTYDADCIYLTGGKNTGIVVSVTAQSNDTITFSVELPDTLESANQVKNVEVLDKALYETYGTRNNNIVINYGNNIMTNLTNAVKVIITYQDDTEYIATMDNCSFVFDSGKIGVSQQATVRYSDSYNTNIVGYFNLTIRDGDFYANINYYPDKRSYSLGEELDLTGLILSITYASGTTTTVAYADSPLLFSYIGFDNTSGGEYQVEVTYCDELGNTGMVIVPISVVANIVSIEINTKNSQQLVCFNATGNYANDYNTVINALPSLIEVIGKQEDNTYCILTGTAYQIKAFDWTGCTTYSIVAQLVLDTSIESPSFNITFASQSAVDSVEVQIEPKLTYKYGECLDLSAGVLLVQLAMDGGSYGVLLDGFYDEFSEDYNCIKTGRQYLTVQIYGIDITLTVTVGTDTSQLLSSKAENVYVNLKNKYYIQSQNSITLSELVNTLASTYTIKVYYNDMYINIKAYGDMVVSDKISIHLFNADDTLVAEISTYILGDTNGDGVLNAEDIDSLADAVVTGVTKNDRYDINKDGIYDIVDFVLLLEKVRG